MWMMVKGILSVKHEEHSVPLCMPGLTHAYSFQRGGLSDCEEVHIPMCSPLPSLARSANTKGAG